MAVRSVLATYTVRLTQGQEIKSTLVNFCQENSLRAPFVLTCVGSVSKATLRMAKPKSPMGESVTTFNKNFEIVSLVGTLNEPAHLHISLSDEFGNVIGGHLMGECLVYTTAEIVIGENLDVVYEREKDEKTGFEELVVKPRSDAVEMEQS